MKSKKVKPDALDDLYEAILCLETKQECEAFFNDLCTALELQTMSQRLQVARMLTDHHVYTDIVETIGASTATISRVNRSLGNGYDIVFMRMEQRRKASVTKDVNSGQEDAES